MSAERYLAFDSPNYPPLGDAEVELEVHRRLLLPRPESAVRFHEVGSPQVADLRLFPGITAEQQERVVAVLREALRVGA